MNFDEPFIDAHQHFWDLRNNPYPWLQGEDVSGFRYGDYAALKRDYLPCDLARDTEGFRPVKTVHIEAEWERATPLGVTHWLTQLARESGWPSAIVGHARLDAPDVDEVLQGQAGYAMVTSTQVRGRTVLRFCLIHPDARIEEVRETADRLARFCA